MLRVSLLAGFLFAFGTACTNSGLGPDGDTTPDDTGVTDDTTPVGGSCKWVGNWQLDLVKCSSFEIDEWFDTYTETHMVVSDDGGGGCTVDFSWNNPGTCSETERWQMSSQGANDVSIIFQGITACDPAGCQFPQDDAACVVGDRTNANAMTFTFDDSTNGKITTTGLLAPAWDVCTLDLVTTWIRL